jgi:hypothetical protein
VRCNPSLIGFDLITSVVMTGDKTMKWFMPRQEPLQLREPQPLQLLQQLPQP